MVRSGRATRGDQPLVVCAGAGDLDWAWCLAIDLRARGADATVLCEPDERARASGLLAARWIVVVHSWFARPGRPGDTEIAAAAARGARVVVVRRNSAKLNQDAYPGREGALSLWGDYYQPRSTGAGTGGGGFVELLAKTLGGRPRLELPEGCVFISYRAYSDLGYVRDVVRPFLARTGFPSWDFRSSERLADDDGLVERLDRLVARSGVVLVVATPGWRSPWTDKELDAARRHARPVLAIRPAGSPPSTDDGLSGVPTYELSSTVQAQERLIRALAGVSERLPT